MFWYRRILNYPTLSNHLENPPFRRTLSTLQNTSIPLASQATIVSKERAREFMSYFPDIVREVMERVKKNSNQEIGNHVVKVRSKSTNLLFHFQRVKPPLLLDAPI